MMIAAKTRSPTRSGRPEPDPAKEAMIAKYLPLARFVAEKVHRRLPPGVDLESLVHSGVIGLLEALDRFDPKRGVEFEVYARYRIQGEVMQCLRSLDWVSRSVMFCKAVADRGWADVTRTRTRCVRCSCSSCTARHTAWTSSFRTTGRTANGPL